jgi:predicted O-linked N-acetylglucosamine transferase (SPINDLY family)
MAKRTKIPNRADQPKKQSVQPDKEILNIFQQGLAFHQRGQLPQAKAAYEQILRMQSKNFGALHLLGVIALQTKSPALAEELIRRAIEVDPNVASAHSNLGNALKLLNRLEDALACYDKAIVLAPDFVLAFNNRGNALTELKRLEDALASYEKAIALKPDFAEAFNSRGIVLKELRRLDDALESYEKASALKPDYAEAFNNRGIVLKELKRLDDALASYDKAIALKPDTADAYNNRGNALKELHRLDDALASYDRAIALKPDYADAFNNRGAALKELHRLDDALESYDRAIALKPDYADAFNNRGAVLKELNRLDDALESYDRAISLKPDYAEALTSRGNALEELKRLDEALTTYDKAIALKPDSAGAFYNRGIVLKELKRLDEALASYDKAIALKPDFAAAFLNRGNVLKQLKRLDEALASYDKAIALKPDFAEAFLNRGNALEELKRLDDALASYDRLVALKPDYADAFYNRGIVLKKLKRLDDALASYDRAIALKPDHADAFNNRGNALKELMRPDEALASYNQVIAFKPDFAEAFVNRGAVLQELKRLDDALASYDKAIDLKSDFADAFLNRGNVLKELKRLDDALASYDKAIALKPDYDFLYGTKIHTQMHLCDWIDIKLQLNKIKEFIEKECKAAPPFAILGLFDDLEIELKASRIYVNQKYPTSSIINDLKTQNQGGKIRIGYYSADFHNHATSVLMAELFEAHDAQKFELYGFSFGDNKLDELRIRVSRGFDYFFDVSKNSDQEIARMSRDFCIDIAVDLKGFTQDCRMGIFAERAAPLQISYLGYPGTSAAPYFEYLVADEILIPLESRKYYSEKIIYMPHSYQVNDSKRNISPKLFTRQDLGLPEIGFVFCCFNNNYKIMPETFDIWMRLLKKVSGSVLWLLEDNPTAAKNLRKEAVLRGVEPARLVFAPRMKLDEHLARHRCADLFIDTLPYNAHTTASDALWAGLPVLTQMGQSFAARVGASLLNAMDLPELITNTQEEYECKAIELANDPLRLTHIKKKLEQNRETSPLFNGRLFARHIEAAYQEIHRRHLNGEKPDHIDVKSLVK